MPQVSTRRCSVAGILQRREHEQEHEQVIDGEALLEQVRREELLAGRKAEPHRDEDVERERYADPAKLQASARFLESTWLPRCANRSIEIEMTRTTASRAQAHTGTMMDDMSTSRLKGQSNENGLNRSTVAAAEIRWCRRRTQASVHPRTGRAAPRACAGSVRPFAR